MKKLIVFICNGNIYRSVVAAESLRKILEEHKIGAGFSIDSYGLQGTAGTELPKYRHLSQYPKEWQVVKPILRELSIDISKHSFQKISIDIMKEANAVIAMDNKVYSTAKNSLMNQFPGYAEKIHKFSELTMQHSGIKDPAGSESEMLHRKVIKDIYSTIAKRYKDILMWTE